MKNDGRQVCFLRRQLFGHNYRDNHGKMVKSHAFCNDICDTIDIAHTRCYYTKVTKTKRILRKYFSFKYDTEDDTQIEYLMKLYELRTGQKLTYWTVPLQEEIKELFGCHETDLRILPASVQVNMPYVNTPTEKGMFLFKVLSTSHLNSSTGSLKY